jgi:hypothetical protein
LSGIGTGEYQVALIVNGIRASNVISIKIDPKFNPATAPPLELGVIEPNPFSSRARLIVRARGPTPFDPQFKTYDVYWAAVVIDGIERILQVRFTSGTSVALESGTSCWFIPNLTNYQPTIEPNHLHTVNVKAGKYEAAPLIFDPMETKLNVEWDAMSPNIKDAAP